MPLDKSQIKKILVVSLTNIGDIVMTFPVIDVLKRDFPEAQLSVVVGPKGAPLLKNTDCLHEVIIYNKRHSLLEKAKWINRLRKEHFDLVVDLRNSSIPFLLGTRYRTSPFMERFAGKHMRAQHLNRLKSIYDYGEKAEEKICLQINEEDKERVKALTLTHLGADPRFVIVSPGAADEWKRWSADGFAQVCDYLIETQGVKIVFVGSETDTPVVRNILEKMKHPAVDFTGQTSLIQLAVILRQCEFAIVNDSAPMHLASYLNVPVLALFGPTHPRQYGPWSLQSEAIKKDVDCPACRKEKGVREHICMAAITPEDVLAGVKRLRNRGPRKLPLTNYQNILIVRTDRIGDVVLTTPSIQALREAYPYARLTVLVSPVTRSLLEGNPYLDEILVDDRAGEHRGVFGFFRLISLLRSKKFDLAVNFHTKKRTNALCFFAGIPNRVGYHNNKFGFLLTKKIQDNRPQGIKHESQYCLDVVRALGVIPQDPDFFVGSNAYDNSWVEKTLDEKIERGPIRLMFAVHPGASCPTKEWPAERFAELIGQLMKKYSCHVVLVGAGRTQATAAKIRSLCGADAPILDLTGQTTVSQLTSLLKRSDLLISNDSGPVHVADAQGTPVVSIFTRNQPGINPERWRPLGFKSKTVVTPFKGDVSFAKGEISDPSYLQMITTNDVLQAVDALFKLC